MSTLIDTLKMTLGVDILLNHLTSFFDVRIMLTRVILQLSCNPKFWDFQTEPLGKHPRVTI